MQNDDGKKLHLKTTICGWNSQGGASHSKLAMMAVQKRPYFQIRT